MSKDERRRSANVSISKLPISITFKDISNVIMEYDVISLRLLQRNNTKTLNLEFSTPEDADSLKEVGFKLNGEEYPLHYTRPEGTYTYVASPTKCFVGAPAGTSLSEVTELLGDVAISKPDPNKSYMFVNCKSSEDQMDLIKKYNGKDINKGKLTVRVAVEKSNRRKKN